MLDRIDEFADRLRRSRSHVIGAAIHEFIQCDQSVIETAIVTSPPPSGYGSAMTKVSVTLSKTTHHAMATVAQDICRTYAEILRSAVEQFLALDDDARVAAVKTYMHYRTPRR
jgi:predicted transcriptional regulator